MTSHDFASHMVCFNKSNFSLAMNKVAVLVSRVKSTNALRAHQREWLLTNLPDS